MTRAQRLAILAVDRGDATFDQWFLAQYGPEPPFNPLDLRDAQIRVDDLRSQGHRAAEWSIRRDAARMAWTAATSNGGVSA